MPAWAIHKTLGRSSRIVAGAEARLGEPSVFPLCDPPPFILDDDPRKFPGRANMAIDTIWFIKPY